MKRGKALGILAIVFVVAGLIYVQAYGTSQPTVLGHTLGELAAGTFSTGNYTFPDSVTILSKLGIGGAPGIHTLRVTGSANITGNLYANGVNTGAGQIMMGTTETQQTGGTITYFPLMGATSSSTNLNSQTIVPVAGVFSTLRCNLPVAPGGSASRTIHLRKNSANTALTCTITGASTTCSDLSNSVSFAAGDVVNYQQTPASSPASSRVRCAVVFKPS